MTSSASSVSIIKDKNLRFSPLFIDLIIPEDGVVINVPGFFLFSNNFCPARTVSPSSTSIVGLRPT